MLRVKGQNSWIDRSATKRTIATRIDENDPDREIENGIDVIAQEIEIEESVIAMSMLKPIPGLKPTLTVVSKPITIKITSKLKKWTIDRSLHKKARIWPKLGPIFSLCLT